MRTNIEFFKLVDPVVQSLLFIFFAYSLGGEFPYHLPLMLLAGWQLISWGINFLLRSVKLLKDERLAWLVFGVLYLAAYFYIRKHIPEKFVDVRDATGLTSYPVHEVILITTGLLLAFWYFFVCFREVRVIMKKFNNNR